MANWDYLAPDEKKVEKKKGRGPGHWGHKGRPGKRGGSLPGKGKAISQKAPKGKQKAKVGNKGKELLIQHYAANTMGDGYKLTNLNFEQRLRALQKLGLAEKDSDTGWLVLTAEAERFLHSKECEQEAVRRRRALYKK